MTPREVSEAWRAYGQMQARRGTEMHRQIERWLNGFEDGAPSFEVRCFLRFVEDFLVPRGLRSWRTELSVFHCGLLCAGQIDFVAADEEGGLFVIDWKRCADLAVESRFGETMKEPLAHLPNTNYWHYALQVNLYARFLEEEYGKTVRGMYLVVLHPSNDGPLCAEVERMPREMAAIQAHEEARGRARDSRPGADASFL